MVNSLVGNTISQVQAAVTPVAAPVPAPVPYVVPVIAAAWMMENSYPDSRAAPRFAAKNPPARGPIGVRPIAKKPKAKFAVPPTVPMTVNVMTPVLDLFLFFR